MQRAVPHPLLDRLTLLLVIGLLAAPATYLQVNQPSWQEIGNFLTGNQLQETQQPAPHPQAKPKAVETKAPAPVVTPPVVAPPPVAPPATPAVKTATTNSFVHFRSGKGTNTPIIADLEAGTVIQLRDDADATWQGVTYNGQKGYIYRSYIQY